MNDSTGLCKHLQGMQRPNQVNPFQSSQTTLELKKNSIGYKIKDEYAKLHLPSDKSPPARFYGLSEIHKANTAFMPKVSEQLHTVAVTTFHYWKVIHSLQKWHLVCIQ